MHELRADITRFINYTNFSAHRTTFARATGLGLELGSWLGLGSSGLGLVLGSGLELGLGLGLGLGIDCAAKVGRVDRASGKCVQVFYDILR